jgi:orotate phosphoribosyltransferase
MTNLFTNKKFLSHSGKELDFKIECDCLNNQDIKTLAKIITKKYNFNHVCGVPTGGIRLAKELEKYCSNDPYEGVLIVDDVLTTGKSMNEIRKEYLMVTSMKIQGVVIFARGECPDWVSPIFKFW